MRKANSSPKKPGEIPEPPRGPDTIPAHEPEPAVPSKTPEIQPGKEPITSPPRPPEFPERQD